jgi:hypothetical protein
VTKATCWWYHGLILLEFDSVMNRTMLFLMLAAHCCMHLFCPFHL